MTLITDVLLVPYGTDTLSPQPIEVRLFGDGKVGLDAPFPCAAVNTATGLPLRLNSEALSRSAGAPQDVAPLSLIKDHLKSFCRTWDKLSLTFLDCYFEHISDMLKFHQSAIAAKLAPFLGLYSAEDWAFAAPKPLPRAHLYAPHRTGSAHWSIDDFVQADFAFWLGDRLVAVLSEPEVLTPVRARERLVRLEQAAVSVVRFTAESLATDRTNLFIQIVDDFGALLESAGPVPISPFRPEGLGAQ
jgi:hypothetical protein